MAPRIFQLSHLKVGVLVAIVATTLNLFVLANDLVFTYQHPAPKPDFLRVLQQFTEFRVSH
jgi:hypothetical protein